MNKTHFPKRLLFLIIVVPVMLILSACSSSSTPSTISITTQTVKPSQATSTTATAASIPTPPPVSTPTPAAATTSAPVTTPAYTVRTTSKAGFGDYLVDARGMTLYYFARDINGKSNAAGNILAAWPIFNPTGFTVPSSLKSTDFGTIVRDDGQKQATYKGWPLYYYAKDLAPGDTLGEAVGGIWFVIKTPFYNVMLQTKSDLGNYLVDSRGMTLYYFTKDSVGKSVASADILKIWPIFNSADFVVPSSLKSADFGTFVRDDGQKQASYKGFPLYYFSKDLISGDTSGQGVNSVWYAINPEKFPPQPSTSSASPSPSASSGPDVTIDLISQGMAFDKGTITVQAGASVTINFNNKDNRIPHNFALYTNSSAATPIFVGQTIAGPATVTYKFTAPSTPGTYFFRCDIHPLSMTGSFIVNP